MGGASEKLKPNDVRVKKTSNYDGDGRKIIPPFQNQQTAQGRLLNFSNLIRGRSDLHGSAASDGGANRRVPDEKSGGIGASLFCAAPYRTLCWRFSLKSPKNGQNAPIQILVPSSYLRLSKFM